MKRPAPVVALLARTQAENRALRADLHDALVAAANLRTELAASERLNQALMQWCPADLREMDL